MKEIKGQVNVFKFVGTYDKGTGEWNKEAVPADVNDFIFWIENDGTCYVETSQNFEYDASTGSFYLIMEVK